MSDKLSVQTIKEETERTKESLEIRQGKQPPMSQRLTMSVSALLNYCNRTLFLCKIIYELTETTRIPRLLVEGKSRDVKALEEKLCETGVEFF